MIRTLTRRFALGVVLALGCSSVAVAQQIPDGAYKPNGAHVDTQPTITFGASNFTPGQVTVQTTATLVVAARSGRQSITLISNCSNPIELGNANVTTTTGVILPGTVGASITLNFTGALYAVGGSSCPVSYYELY